MLPRFSTSCVSAAATCGSCSAPMAAAGPVSRKTAGVSGVLRARGVHHRAGAGEVCRAARSGRKAKATRSLRAPTMRARCSKRKRRSDVAGRRGAVVEAGEREAVEVGRDVEGGEGGADGGQVEVFAVRCGGRRRAGASPRLRRRCGCPCARPGRGRRRRSARLRAWRRRRRRRGGDLRAPSGRGRRPG